MKCSANDALLTLVESFYLFTVKDNQPTLKCDIASLQMEASPP